MWQRCPTDETLTKTLHHFMKPFCTYDCGKKNKVPMVCFFFRCFFFTMSSSRFLTSHSYLNIKEKAEARTYKKMKFLGNIYKKKL